MSVQPIFSIVIPCFNQAHYLDDAVKSIIDQSLSNWEMIIVNDGSTDNTMNIADEWASRDNRIRCIHQENAGLAMARNNGYASTSGLFIHFLDADDKLRPNALSTFSDALSGGADIAVCGYAYFNDGKTLYKEVIPTHDSAVLLTRNIAPPVAFAVRRSALSVSGLFDSGFAPAEDWDMWVRFYKAGLQFSFISQILAEYRVVPNSMSRNAIRMYTGFKQVAHRAVKRDSRILEPSSGNRDYPEVETNNGIQHSLAICIGLLVMQGKLEEAKALFQEETSELALQWTPDKFAAMCSFLSFRYWTSKEEVERVFNELMPLYTKFFAAIGLSKKDADKAIRLVFQHHQRLRNKHRFGVLSKLIKG